MSDRKIWVPKSFLSSIFRLFTAIHAKLAFAIVFFLIAPSLSMADNVRARAADNGSSEKLRILVDKVLTWDQRPRRDAQGVMQPARPMTEQQVAEIASAGFNVVVPRWGGNDLNMVRDVASHARKHGVRTMPWIRGSVLTGEPLRNMVWRDGTVQSALASPNDQQLWQSIRTRVIDYAWISTEFQSLMGVFLDFENYDKQGSRGHCYGLSYDLPILREFAANQKIDLPELQPADRYRWLKEKGLDEKFADFQIRSWRERCQALRREVDAINPLFQFAVYPAPGTIFAREAIYPSWATEEAPLILADPSTYARSLPFVGQKASLVANRQKILDHVAFVRKSGIPFQYLGGIDPLLELDNPEFCGKNAAMLAEAVDGYWVFYEGPTYGQRDHASMFDWFGRANRSISAGQASLHHQPRRSPENLGPSSIDGASGNRPILLHEGIGIGLHKQLRKHRGEDGTAAFDAHFLESMAPSYLHDADAVILQSSIRWRPAEPQTRKDLRQYVMNGGGLLISHLGWTKRGCTHPETACGDEVLTIHDVRIESLFPEIASWLQPTSASEDPWHVLDREMKVTAAHRALGELQPGKTFQSAASHHMVLAPGPDGQVLISNRFEEPVLVVGQYGKGRVALSGSCYGFWSMAGDLPNEKIEQDAFYAILEWLAAASKR